MSAPALDERHLIHHLDAGSPTEHDDMHNLHRQAQKIKETNPSGMKFQSFFLLRPDESRILNLFRTFSETVGSQLFANIL